MIIHWDAKFEIGNKLIDTEHRMLVMLFKKLDVAIKTGQPEDAVLRVFLEVKKFAEFHFLSEENLMREVGYPELGRHEVMHSHLLSQLDLLISRINRKKDFPGDVLFFLNNWLITHIGLEDQKIADYVRKSVDRPIAEDIYVEFLR